MKKILIFLICLFTLGMMNVDAYEFPYVTNHEKVTIYMFRGSGCSHCYEALEFFYDTTNDYPQLQDFVEFKIYETWENNDNRDLFYAVAEKFGEDADGVPYIVIGNSYHQAGFMSLMGEDIIQTALDEYQNSNYVDVVQTVIDDGALLSDYETLNAACIQEGIIASDDNKGKGVIPLPDIDDEEYLDEGVLPYEDDDVALTVITILLVVSVVINITSLPLAIVFIILFVKEKKKNKKEN